MIKFDLKKRFKELNMRKIRVAARSIVSSKKRLAIVSVAGVLVLGGGIFAATQLSAKKNPAKTNSGGKNTASLQRGGSSTDGSSRSKSSNPSSGSQSAGGQSKQMIESRIERLQKRIDDAVKNKRLTKEQADKATNKLKELSAAREKVIDKPRAEQIKSLSDTRKALTEWAKQNKIPLSYFSGIL